MHIGVSIGKMGEAIGAAERGELTPDWLARQVRSLIDIGVDHIEILSDVLVAFPDHLGAAAVERLAELNDRVTYSIHLPIWLADLASPNEKFRASSVATCVDMLPSLAPLKPVQYVVHITSAVSDGFVGTSQVPAGRRAITGFLAGYARRSLLELAEFVDPELLCVENMETVPFGPIWEQLADLGSSICYDVGHLALQSGDAERFLDRYLPRIREIHLHDATTLHYGGRVLITSDHRDVGDGTLDLPGLLASLRQRGYDQLIVLEVPNAQRSLQTLAAWGEFALKAAS